MSAILHVGTLPVHPACFQVTELDISDKAQTNATWLAWDRRFFALTLRHIQLYEELNPMVKTFVNPSEDASKRPGVIREPSRIGGGPPCWGSVVRPASSEGRTRH